MAETNILESPAAGVVAAANDDPRWIAIRVSRINLAVVAIGALLAFPLLFWLPIPPWWRLGILLPLIAAMARDLCLILLRGKDSAVAFYLFDSLEAAGEGARRTLAIRVRYTQAPLGRAALLAAREAEGTVVPGGFVSPLFTVVRYRLPGDPAWRRWWPRLIPLWADSLDQEAFRRTRVALKWK